MESSKIEELSKDVQELNKLSEVATRPKVKDILLIEIRKIETNIIKLKELETSAVKDSSAPVTNRSTSNPVKCYDVVLSNYAWDQSDNLVRIFVELPGIHNLPDEKVSCDFSVTEMKLSVPELNNRNYTLTIKNLYHPIVPDKSHWKIKKDKVIVYMEKAKGNKHWTSLTANEKTSKKMDDIDPMDSSDPSQGIFKLMKKMYDDGDDEMKRNIVKAWAEGQEKRHPEF